MNFSSQLTEALLLKRVLGFMAEIILPNKQKLMIRCPRILEMPGCDILGTKIWFSNAMGYHCLPTWELVEVDGGYLVNINPESIKPLVLEAINQQLINQLHGYTLVHNGNQYEPNATQLILLEKNKSQCYLGLEYVLTEQDNYGIFPNTRGEGINTLQSLIKAAKQGYRTILFYCVTHNGITCLDLNRSEDSQYKKLINLAMQHGVELCAYKVSITQHSMEITQPMPILTAEDARKIK